MRPATSALFGRLVRSVSSSARARFCLAPHHEAAHEEQARAGVPRLRGERILSKLHAGVRAAGREVEPGQRGLRSAGPRVQLQDFGELSLRFIGLSEADFHASEQEVRFGGPGIRFDSSFRRRERVLGPLLRKQPSCLGHERIHVCRGLREHRIEPLVAGGVIACCGTPGVRA